MPPACVADATLLSEIRSRVQAVVNGAMTNKQAVRLLRESFAGENADALAALGFAPKRDAQGIAQLASIPRLKLIMDTNVRLAQECGHYRQWEAVKEFYPIGVWHCGYSEVHRKEHLARDGQAFDFGHPIWTQSPPGGEFNCHCWRENMTAEAAARRGIVPQPEDFPFAPSSLGFDPSRPLDGSTVKTGSRVLPQFAQQAEDAKCPDDVLLDMNAENAEQDDDFDFVLVQKLKDSGRLQDAMAHLAQSDDIDVRNSVPVFDGKNTLSTLKTYAGKDIKNRDTGIKAQINRTQRAKIISPAAVMKSVRNGFTVHDHLEAAENLWAIYENSILQQERPDKKNKDKNLNIRIFVSPIILRSGKMAKAIITQKISLNKDNPAKLYSLELDEIKKPPAKTVAEAKVSEYSTGGESNLMLKLKKVSHAIKKIAVVFLLPQ